MYPYAWRQAIAGDTAAITAATVVRVRRMAAASSVEWGCCGCLYFGQ